MHYNMTPRLDSELAPFIWPTLTHHNVKSTETRFRSCTFEFDSADSMVLHAMSLLCVMSHC